MGPKILCVAEKPSIAKAVSAHLSGGQFTTRETREKFIKNYEFHFNFAGSWGDCDVVMTSVVGHLTGVEFHSDYKAWKESTIIQLFQAPLLQTVDKDKVKIADNIAQQARYAGVLYIWTDCDREGEHIGSEIRQAALKGNSRLEVKRARFSNTERSHIIQAARNPIVLDERQIQAVSARIELDLRVGAALTRFQTLNFRSISPDLDSKVISYGPCQFPTLGFVVDRYMRVRNFVPETFWSIKVTHKREGKQVVFNWDRVRLFDRAAVTILFERCLTAQLCKVTNLQTKPTSKWRPLPLTTVELQKMGSRFLRMDSQRIMKIAEELYNKGWISYPRTETDQFDRAMDLRKLVEKQTPDNRWGQFSQRLLDGEFQQPRSGSHNDQAHPPIHPVNYVAPQALNVEEGRVYEFVVRRFLACCSKDAKGQMTTVNIEYGHERFHASGLLVLEKNYLEIYPYERWESSQQLPNFSIGETFKPSEASIYTGQTTPPGYLTEPELIALMDANGIGTDATMAEHISKVKSRDYVQTRPQGGGGRGSSTAGRGRGRGGRAGSNAAAGRGTGAVEEFIPTFLGVSLIVGYDKVGLTTSLGKPFLRKETEQRMKEICTGAKGKDEVVQDMLQQYREVYTRAAQNLGVLSSTVRSFVVDRNPHGT